MNMSFNGAEAEEPEAVLRPPATKQARDACSMYNGDEMCGEITEAPKQCTRDSGHYN